MSVTVTFECGGCGLEAPGTRPLHRRFRGISGRPWGFGHYHYDSPQDVAPEGWVPFDPYTGACYCAACWQEIESDPSEPGAALEARRE